MHWKSNYFVKISLLIVFVMAFAYAGHGMEKTISVSKMSDIGQHQGRTIDISAESPHIKRGIIGDMHTKGIESKWEDKQEAIHVLSRSELLEGKSRLEQKLALHAQNWEKKFSKEIGRTMKQMKMNSINQPPAGGFVINGNEELVNQSIKYGWMGNGSANNPYIISGYGFQSVIGDPCNFTSIDIYNTSLYVKIVNNTFNRITCPNTAGYNWDGGFGIRLKSVKNVIISGNEFTDMANDGILMQNISNILIEGNVFTNVTRSAIFGGYIGFPLLGQNIVNITIRGNSFNNTGVYHPKADEVFGDIYIDPGTGYEARNITVSNNSIKNSRSDYTVFIDSVFGATVEDNFIYNTTSNDGGSQYGASNIYVKDDYGVVTIKGNIIRSSVNKSGIVAVGGEVTIDGNEISFNRGIQDRIMGIFNALDVGIDAVGINELWVTNNTVISNTYLSGLYLFTGYDDGSVSASGNWSIINNTFSYNDATGIWVEGMAFSVEPTDIYITENKVDTNKKHGLLAGSVEYLRVNSNTFSYNDMNGILLYSVRYSSFGYNDEIGNGLSGINATNLQYNFMHPYAYFPNDDPSLNNDFVWDDIIENGKDGISIGNGDGYTIKNMNIKNNKRHGIYTLTGIGSSIVSNTIQNNSRDGILNWAIGVNISENMISDNGGTGVSLTSTANETSITYNYIMNQSESGISVEFGPNGTEIIGNIVEGNNKVGISFDGEYTVIANNTIRWNMEYGIDGTGKKSKIANNIILANGEEGIRLSRDINDTKIIHNAIERNDGSGIFINKGGFDLVQIVANNITSNWGSGINLTEVENPAVNLGKLQISENNIFQSDKDGVFVSNLNGFLDITKNKISHNGFGSGIEIIDSFPFVNVSQNEIVDNLESGISYAGNVTNLDMTIYMNNIADAFEGITINTTEFGSMSIRKNTISKTFYGLKVYSFYGEADISDNTVRDSKKYGIYLNNVNDTRLSYNGVYNSGKNGLILGENSKNTNVTLNDFSFNLRRIRILRVSQAIDNGNNNIFSKNFWSDWVSPDNDGDNYVDFPYQINGTAGNQDPLPRALRPTTLPHLLLKPYILYPEEGDGVSGIVNVTWAEAIDTANHQVTYDLYYSNDGGGTWIKITGTLTGEFYLWDTIALADGEYMLKLLAKDSLGYTTYDISGIFTISNGNGTVPHELTPITLISPNGGEILKGSIMISWTKVNDTFGHNISYSLYYSKDGGNTWNLIVTNLTEVTDYLWDSTSVSDGKYLIMVNATDGEGLSVSDMSDNEFTIQNQNNTQPTSTTTSEQSTTFSTSITSSSTSSATLTKSTDTTASQSQNGFVFAFSFYGVWIGVSLLALITRKRKEDLK